MRKKLKTLRITQKMSAKIKLKKITLDFKITTPNNTTNSNNNLIIIKTPTI